MVAVVVVMACLCIGRNYGHVGVFSCQNNNSVEKNLCVVMTLPGPITRGRPRRTYSEATAAATLRPTMPTAPTPTAAPVWVGIVMMSTKIVRLISNTMVIRLIRLVEDLGF